MRAVTVVGGARAARPFVLTACVGFGALGCGNPSSGEDAAPTDAAPGEIVVTWTTLRGTAPTTCEEARVEAVEIRVRRTEEAVASVIALNCDALAWNITDLAPGEYTVTGTPLDAGGRARSSPIATTVTLAGSSPVVAPFEFAFPEGGRVFVTWTMIENGSSVSCSDIGADRAILFANTPEVPCEDYMVLSGPIPLGTHALGLMLFGGWYRDPAFSFEVTLTTHEEVQIIPLVYEFLDEPERQLLEMAAAARAYYETSPDPKMFPSPDASVTPWDPTACWDVCDPDPSLWTGPPWTTLGFAVTSPHRSSYDYASAGSGTGATFTATAWVDYDGDAAWTKYQVIGAVDAAGNVIGTETVVATPEGGG